MHFKFKNTLVYLSAAIGNLVGFTGGIAFTWSSPMLPKLTGTCDNPLDRPATLFEASWIAALIGCGSIFGPPVAGYAADKIGRKKAIIILACPIFLSLLMMAFAKSVIMLLIARFIMGLGAGSVFTILPMYYVEISEDYYRGTLASFMVVFTTLGNLFSYAIGPLLSVQNFCLVGSIPLMIFFPACFFFIPESPHFLALTNDEKNLKKTLLQLRSHKSTPEIEVELINVTKTVEEQSKDGGRFMDLFKYKIFRKGLLISAGIMTFQQFAGITVVMSYMQTIFEGAGSALTPHISSTIIGILQVIITLMASYLTDVSGRRILLLSSLIGSGLSLLTLGVSFFLKENNVDVEDISWIPVTSLIVYCLSFALGLGPLPWTITAEILPPNIKAKALTITALVCFTENFLITLVFPSMASFIGMGLSFWLFAAICFIGAFIMYLFLPETKGKSLREIQKLLGENPTQ